MFQGEDFWASELVNASRPQAEGANRGARDHLSATISGTDNGNQKRLEEGAGDTKTLP